MRTPVSCGSRNPLSVFPCIARAASTIISDSKCARNSARRLPCRSNQKRGQSGFAALVFVFGTATLATPAADAQSSSNSYVDDTHAILQSCVAVETVSGPFGYQSYKYSEPADGEQLALDVRNASFIVANSANANPTASFDCEMGSQPVNTYPFKVYDPDLTSVVGGIINGEIPQESDWQHTYCNSASVIFKNAPDSTIDGLRITSAWDAIRTDPNSPDLTVKNSWISNVRDDAIENDHFMPLLFEDNLVDGTFQGISVDSGGEITNPAGAKIRVYGSVIRIRDYLYKGKQQFGALFKNEDSSPTSIIHNTVVAVDSDGGSTWRSHWERSWSKIEECSNNLFLWLSDDPMPSSIGTPPACFTVLTGAAARTEWNRARKNWIDCHPDVARTPADPASNTRQCVANTFGGYSLYWGEDSCNQSCH